MKNAFILFLILAGLAPQVHAVDCTYVVEAHITSKKITYISDFLELGYPAGSKDCSRDLTGQYLRREEKLEERFLALIRNKNPGLEISSANVHAKRFDSDYEIKIIRQLANDLATSGKPDGRGHRVIALSGRFYSE